MLISNCVSKIGRARVFFFFSSSVRLPIISLVVYVFSYSTLSLYLSVFPNLRHSTVRNRHRHAQSDRRSRSNRSSIFSVVFLSFVHSLDCALRLERTAAHCVANVQSFVDRFRSDRLEYSTGAVQNRVELCAAHYAAVEYQGK